MNSYNPNQPARTIASAIAAMFLAGTCLLAAAGPAKADVLATAHSVIVRPA